MPQIAPLVHDRAMTWLQMCSIQRMLYSSSSPAMHKPRVLQWPLSSPFQASPGTKIPYPDSLKTVGVKTPEDALGFQFAYTACLVSSCMLMGHMWISFPRVLTQISLQRNLACSPLPFPLAPTPQTKHPHRVDPFKLARPWAVQLD